MNGPGKYDDLATYCREQAQSTCVVLYIGNGKRGMGFEVQADAMTLAYLPELLESLAGKIRAERAEIDAKRI